MRTIIQRVDNATVHISGNKSQSISKGIVALIAFETECTDIDFEWIIKKLKQLRIFDDKSGQMNLSLEDVKGDLMIVSQFTLFASTKKGNRPSYKNASSPEIALAQYNKFVELLKSNFKGHLALGEFGADMKIELTNNGPITISIDSRTKE